MKGSLKIVRTNSLQQQQQQHQQQQQQQQQRRRPLTQSRGNGNGGGGWNWSWGVGFSRFWSSKKSSAKGEKQKLLLPNYTHIPNSSGGGSGGRGGPIMELQVRDVTRTAHSPLPPTPDRLPLPAYPCLPVRSSALPPAAASCCLARTLNFMAVCVSDSGGD